MPLFILFNERSHMGIVWPLVWPLLLVHIKPSCSPRAGFSWIHTIPVGCLDRRGRHTTRVMRCIASRETKQALWMAYATGFHFMDAYRVGILFVSEDDISVFELGPFVLSVQFVHAVAAWPFSWKKSSRPTFNYHRTLNFQL
ncbi:hypothetical protein CDEST_07722 [Colletotrichum destructivum]|uniref:Secreted protein n=1 Tax=Colletotrichum destructivum TaxID=34406 RepID=A0AAX4II45_9PEZI|nr:hypothetical protein CDEST_07722 [Colletotrichum destructivum]